MRDLRSKTGLVSPRRPVVEGLNAVTAGTRVRWVMQDPGTFHFVVMRNAKIVVE